MNHLQPSPGDRLDALLEEARAFVRRGLAEIEAKPVLFRECSCLRCQGETCYCPHTHPPCRVCTDSCDPDGDPDTRLLLDACPNCGAMECGCDRRPV